MTTFEGMYKKDEARKEKEGIRFYQDRKVAAEGKEKEKYNALINRKWDKDCYTQTRVRHFYGSKLRSAAVIIQGKEKEENRKFYERVKVIYSELEEGERKTEDDIIAAKYGVMMKGYSKLREVYQIWFDLEEGEEGETGSIKCKDVERLNKINNQNGQKWEKCSSGIPISLHQQGRDPASMEIGGYSLWWWHGVN